MKSPGLTFFPVRVVMPTRAEDAIWNAVEDAQTENWTLDRFIREARSAWAEGARRDDEAEAAL